MRQGRWKSIPVARRYIRSGSRWHDHAGAAGRIARFREETRGERIGIAQEAEERFHKYVTWGATMGGVTKRFNPGGGGGRSSSERRVMIGRWMRRHGRGRGAGTPNAPSSTSQVF